MTFLRPLPQWLSAGILVVLCALSAVAAAQQDSKTQSTGKKTNGETSSSTTVPPAKPAASTGTKDTFTPSEEVSEDLSVSFPVDI